jgi:hypothetical protein
MGEALEPLSAVLADAGNRRVSQAAQRQLYAWCFSGLGSGRSNTWRTTWSVAIAAVKAAPHVAQICG